MELFVIRHATAVPGREDFPDEARALTPKGKRRFEAVVRGLERLDVRFDHLLHSPILRAVETAECLVPLLDGPTEVTAWLVGPPSRELLARLSGERVAVVGHEPGLSALVAWLVVGSPKRGEHFALGKGAVAWLDGAPKPGEMRLMALLPGSVARQVRG